MGLNGLYAVTPEGLGTAELLRRVALALQGGVRLVQYRDKSADAALRQEQAAALAALCHAHAARLIINDDLRLALESGADGVHLGRGDGDLAAARAALGPGKILGASCYNEIELARKAARLGADYLAFGSVFPSTTKPGAVPATLTLLAQAKAEFILPICAIGGITLEKAPQLIAAGVDLLAVISDLFEAPGIAARAASYASIWQMPLTPRVRPS